MNGRITITALAILLTAVTDASAAAWRQLQNPADAGWSPKQLDAAFQIAAEAKTASVMVVEHGVVVAAWGPVDRAMPIYSMRKGIYNALAGMLVTEGELRLDTTLRELGIDEADGLTDAEREATVADLLASRSGVYHPSAYEPASMKRGRPERGSHAPGTYWFYNNWDFNVVGHLIETAAGKPLATFFRDRLAAPLQMEDVADDDVFEFAEPSRTRFPAVIFRMSTRDLARFGQLYLDGGVWNGTRLLDASWIRTSWTPHTTFEAGSPWGEGNGFGFLWWIHPALEMVLTRGSGGQVVAIVPGMELVIVHQTDTENHRDGSFDDAVRVIDAILAAKTAPRTTALHPAPLPDALPAPARRTAVAWTPDTLASLIGTYALSPNVSFVVHQVDRRLFALPKGIPLAEVELFVDADGTIFSPVLDFALRTIRNREGTVMALEGTVEQRHVRLER